MESNLTDNLTESINLTDEMILYDENSSIDQPVNDSSSLPLPSPGLAATIWNMGGISQPRREPGAFNDSEPLPGGESLFNNSLSTELQPGPAGQPAGGGQPGEDPAFSSSLDNSEAFKSEQQGAEFYSSAWREQGDNSLSSDPSGGEPAGRLLLPDQSSEQPSEGIQAFNRTNQDANGY